MNRWGRLPRERAPRKGLLRAGGPNRLFRIGTEISGEVGSPTAEYVMGTYALADDECLLAKGGLGEDASVADTPDGDTGSGQERQRHHFQAGHGETGCDPRRQEEHQCRHQCNARRPPQ